MKFSGGRKKDGRKGIEKMVTIERLTKKIFQKNRRGGCINPPPPPVPARVNPRTAGGAHMCPPIGFSQIAEK